MRINEVTLQGEINSRLVELYEQINEAEERIKKAVGELQTELAERKGIDSISLAIDEAGSAVVMEMSHRRNAANKVRELQALAKKMGIDCVTIAIGKG